MAKYPNITLTNAGLNMIAESQGSGQLIFTNIKLGDGSLAAGEDIKVLAAVKNPLLTANITDIDTKTAGQTTLTAVISNAAVTSGFFAKEMGVYAKVGSDGVEKLYAYTNAGNYADYMPDKTAQINENQIKITLIVGNAANVTAIIDGSIVYPTKEVMTESISAAVETHDEKATTHAPAFAAHNADTASHADIRAALKKAGGVPIGTITARLSKKPEAGELAVDTGALISRATYPDLWAWVQSNAPLLSESDWQTQAAAQTSVGAYSTGDGSTTFRLPRLLDYVGGGLATDVGKWQSAGLPNIIGHVYNVASPHQSIMTYDGALYELGHGSSTQGTGSAGAICHFGLDASRSSAIYGKSSTVQPPSVKILYCVKAFDGEANQGLVDITSLANDVANINNSFAVIYPNAGTAATPATITVNSRYVETNPFSGYNIDCQVQCLIGGKWVNVDWTGTFTAGLSYGCGARAALYDGNIILQTGSYSSLIANSNMAGNALGNNSLSIVSAPARILVRKGGKLL